jgi:hypothetical protein
MLVRGVIVRVFISTKYNSLADKVKRIRTIVEIAIGSFKPV